MKAHQIDIRVFCKPEDDKAQIEKAFMSLLPFDTAKEKVRISKKNAIGFNKRVITIIETTLKKQRHINSFLDALSQMMNQNQKQNIITNCRKLIDDHLCIFFRFDKLEFVKDRKLRITDSGECFHIKVSLAAFPRKLQNAEQTLRDILGQREILPCNTMYY
ncbi:hypothetical protein KY320_01825 [Candidatus Woesearchaeota archaeon]|nr:hypothetical protein [Candidatus Woesearchaeota archaeon]